jgi:hypothetical protein
MAYVDGGESVENSSTPESANKMAFMPRLHTGVPQYRQDNLHTTLDRNRGWDGGAPV